MQSIKRLRLNGLGKLIVARAPEVQSKISRSVNEPSEKVSFCQWQDHRSRFNHFYRRGVGGNWIFDFSVGGLDGAVDLPAQDGEGQIRDRQHDQDAEVVGFGFAV